MIETIAEILIEIAIEEVEIVRVEIMTEKVDATEASKTEIETAAKETADEVDVTEKRSIAVLTKVKHFMMYPRSNVVFIVYITEAFLSQKSFV